MKRLTVFLYYTMFSFIYLGCGATGTCNNIVEGSSESNISSTSLPVTVERGPVLMAEVSDADGNQAINDNLGFSNIYRFATQPVYPITVRGGYVDINRDAKLDGNDTKLDINMLSYSNIVSPLTTLVENNTTLINYLTEHYDINQTQIFNTLPSDTSVKTIVLSNVGYKALRDGYTIDSEKFKQTYDEVNLLYLENFQEISDLNQLASLMEEKIINEIILLQTETTSTETAPTETTSTETTPTETTPTEITRLTQEELETINSTLSTHEVVSSNSNDTTSFIKEYTSTDNIQDIWNLVFKIPTNIDIEKFDIGTHIVKDEPQTIGDIVIEGITIKNNQITNIDSINVFGKKVSGTTGSIGYDSTHDITQNSVALVQGESLIVKLGYIMEKQTIVSSDSFKRVADYNLTVYASNIDINGSDISEEYTLQLTYNKFHTFPKGTQKVNGLVKIGE